MTDLNMTNLLPAREVNAFGYGGNSFRIKPVRGIEKLARLIGVAEDFNGSLGNVRSRGYNGVLKDGVLTRSDIALCQKKVVMLRG